MHYVDLIVETKTPLDRQIFTYNLPDRFLNVKIGQIVYAPLGRRILRALVLKIHQNKPEYPTKEIKSIANYIWPKGRINTLLWMSNYYLLSFGEVLKSFLPPALKRPQTTSFKHFDLAIPQIVLSPEQQLVFESITTDWANNHKKHLLHGVTGSGKTEVYIKLILEVIKNQGQVIVMLPEIFLASVILKRLEATFSNQIGIIHSKLSKSEILNTYDKFYHGEISVIIGPRSCLLLQPQNLKLIIIDEEHDSSYKQEQSPRYDARMLAEKISEYEDCCLLLGSATPRAEIYQRALKCDFKLVELQSRYNQEMPTSQIVDMKKEIKGGNYTMISYKLAEAIDQIIEKNKQVLIFLNRRGVATFVSCRQCGYVEMCPNCQIPLVQHLNLYDNVLLCHQCGLNRPHQPICPECQSSFIKSFGVGVQKVEQELKSRYPEANIVRIDTDLKEKELTQKYHKIMNGDFDILIGTQLIAKGLDLPNVDLVGIISADTALHFPDFQASEKTFQLITQVSGRSGRRDNHGKTIIQSYWPENHAIVAASKHNYTAFYEPEIEARKVFNYPPFSRLIRVVVQHKDQTKAKAIIKQIAKELQAEQFNFIGPAPAFYRMVRSRFRYHIILKIDGFERHKIYDILKPHLKDIIVDIDPVNML